MQNFEQSIENQAPHLISMADDLFDHPEIGLEEFRSSAMLCDYLEKHGFTVERGIAGLPTAFRASYQCGQGGPRLGLFCEYDALEGLGHACAHHLQGPVILGAAVSICETITSKNYSLIVYGAPAEETTSGKLTMLAEGYCRDMDVAMMVHGAPNTSIDKKALALVKYKVTFHGRAAHAASNPEKGRSAFDAAQLMFHGIECMREHVTDDVRIHYNISNLIGAANIVPPLCISEIYVRSNTSSYLESVEEWFRSIVQGAAMMTQTTAEIEEIKRTASRVPVMSLNKLILDNAAYYHAPVIRPPRERTGSSDFSNVMYHTPGACLRFAMVPETASTHSQEFLDAGKTQATHDMLILTSKVIAKTLSDLIDSPEKLAEIHKEFLVNKAEMG